MCGRFTQKADQKTIKKEFKVDSLQDAVLKPRYNIAPTQEIATVLESDGERFFGSKN